jgi:hypothetical protein
MLRRIRILWVRRRQHRAALDLIRRRTEERLSFAGTRLDPNGHRVG